MLKTISITGLSTISQLSIYVTDKNKVGGGENGGNETNLSNQSALKRSTRAGYLTFGNAETGGNNYKNGSGNTKKDGKAARSSDYLTPNAKKTFNHLRNAFIQAFIF